MVQKIAGLIVILIAYLFVNVHFQDVAKSDPDRYFHLGLAKISAHNPVPRSLPQVEDIGWGKRFLEKNFLFTWITGRAYAFGGERAVLQLVPVLGAIFISILYLILSHFLPVVVSVLLIVSALISPDFANRVSLLRPHLLAFSTFFLFLAGLLLRKPVFTFLGGLLFCLSYHAFYLPLSALILTLVLSYFEKSKWQKTVLAGTLGLAIGILSNPYFPYNLLTGTNSFRIATNQASLPTEERPLEVIPIRTDEFLSFFGLFLGLTLLSIVFGLRRRSAEQISSQVSDPRFLISLSLTLLFWTMALISRRAVEYAIPCTLVLTAVTYSVLSEKRLRIIFLSLAIGAITLFSLPKGVQFYRRPLVAGITPDYVIQALEKIPEQEVGKKIFNCEWDNGSFIFYKRPNHRFIDLSDSLLLFNEAPTLYQMRSRLRHGDVAFPYGLVRYVFHADYILCDNRQVIAQLEQDPFFTRLYPERLPLDSERRPGQTSLYVLNDAPLNRFFKNWEITSLGTQNYEPFEIPSPLPASVYLDLFRWAAFKFPEGIKEERACAYLRTHAGDQAGATKLLLGGGEDIKLAVNGKIVFDKKIPMAKPRINHSEIILEKPLSSNDELDASICSMKGSSYWGFSLSSESELISRL